MRFRGQEVRKILIVRLSSIGDVVLSTPVAKALRTACPDAHLSWVVETKSKDAVLGNPYLDEVIVWDRPNASSDRPLEEFGGFIKGLREFKPELRARDFDVAIDLHGLARSALVTWVSGARWRLGSADAKEGAPLFYNVRLKSGRPPLTVPKLYLKMLELLDVYTDDLETHMPISDADREFARSFLSEAVSGSDTCTGVAALCPATTWPQKHWTEEGWALVADALVSKYGMLPVFMGSKVDIPLIDRIAARMKHRPGRAVGKTTLKQAAAIVEQSDLVITVDTGLMHISMALNRPTAAIFGPTMWEHLPKQDAFAVVAKDYSCMPCMRRPACKDYDCMTTISAEDVLRAVDSSLEDSRGQ